MSIRGSLVLAAAREERDGKDGPRKFTMDLYNGGELGQPWSDAPIVIDLQGLGGIERSRPVLKDHNPALIVGHTTAINNNGKSVRVEGVVSGTSAVSRDVVGLADNGFPWQSSIQAAIEKMEYVGENTDVKVNGQTFTGPVYIARQSTFKEASFVALGADDTSSANMAATLAAARSNHQHTQKGMFTMTFEEWLKARGKSPDSLTDDERKTLRAAYDKEAAGSGVTAKAKSQAKKPDTQTATAQTATAQPDPVVAAAQQIDAGRAQIAAEQRRVAEVQRVAASHPEICAKAIEDGWSADRAELEVLRASRPTGPTVSSGRSEPAVANAVLQAALMLSCGVAEKDTGADDKTLQAAHSRYRYGLGIQQLLIEAAMARGYTGPQRVNAGNLKEILAFAMPPLPMTVHAANQFSSIDVGGILGNTANKALMMGFMSVERVWSEIAQVKSHGNFHTHTHYRMTGDLQYEKVAPAGEIAHGTLGEESHTLKVETYAKLLGIPRTSIINDELGALTEVPQRLGRGAALKINDVFWESFLDNSAFFTTGRGNLKTGAAASALDITGLTNVETMFRDQTDADSKPLGLNPALLLVPNALAASARQLMNSAEVRQTAGAADTGVANPFANAFRVLVSSYLSNSAYTGYSSTAWYLLANPAEEATMAIGFLNGQQAPTIEQADASFDTLGIQMRGYHDFGVSKWEYRAGVKASGA
jgi:hypothetical protein